MMKLNNSERMELIGQLIDVFEDFLDGKGIVIPNSEKEQDPDAANIYGTDYGWIMDELEAALVNWELIDKRSE